MNKFFTILLAALLLSISCKNSPSVQQNEKPLIVCTTGMLADGVQKLVGDQTEVIGLMGPGVDPHLYKATQGDLHHLTSADVIIYNGLHLEGKMGEIFDKLKNRKKIIVAADGLSKDQLNMSSNFQGAYDPHIWFDIAIWADVMDYLGAEIEKIEGLNLGIVQTNTNEYTTELRLLDQWVKSEISTIPKEKRVLITAHDAFGYFGKAYDIEVKGLQGISTLSEYGLKDVSDLVNFIVERKIQAVFVESSVSDRSLKAVVEGCEKSGHSISIGGILYSDAMGQAGTAEGEYIGMVKFNVNTIVGALK